MLREGVLRERLRLAFAKATGSFDDFDILSIVGRSQIGRLPYTGEKEQLLEDVPFQSVDEILAKRRDGDLFRYLLDKFAAYSGISGVQPKVLVRDESASSALKAAKPRLSQSYRGDWARRISSFLTSRTSRSIPNPPATPRSRRISGGVWTGVVRGREGRILVGFPEFDDVRRITPLNI